MKKVLLNARQSLLFNKDNPWVKKTGRFDVTMDAFVGCEICELVCLLIIHGMKDSFPQLDFGLFRDDSISGYNKIPGPHLTKLRKDIEAFFKTLSLKITIETILRIVDFLDVTLDMQNKIQSPKLGNQMTKPYT